MRRHLTSVGLLVLAPTIALALPLTSCSEDKSGPNPMFTTLGGSSAGAGTSGGTPASSGVFGASGTGFGTSGTGFGTNGGSGDPVGGGAGAGGGTAGGGTAGGGTAGGGTAGSGTGGVPPVGRVYAIQGCDDASAGGAGGAGTTGGDGAVGGDSAAGGDGDAPPVLGTFASFSVYDFDTDKPVQTCLNKTNDFEITVAGDAPLTVVANIAPGITPGSVIFTYDGVPQASQDIFPYGLGFDTNGDYQEPTPKLGPGKHALTIRAYALPGGLGNVIGQASIVLTVIGS